VSKDRARRRAERQREQALKASARAAEAERRHRREARRQAITAKLPRVHGVQGGVLAQRRRNQLSLTVVLLLALNLVVWLAFPTWAPRLLALLISVLFAPVLHTLLFRRR